MATELNMNEMEAVTGGKGGSPTKLPEKKGFIVYRIQSGDCLSKIAPAFNTTTNYLMSINPTITNKNDITAGYWIYVPAKQSSFCLSGKGLSPNDLKGSQEAAPSCMR